MFRNLLLPFLFLPSLQVFAAADTVIIPINRQLFHERINEEQKLLDRADGKQDGLLRISGNAEINKTVTEIMFKKIDALEDSIELNKKIPGNNEKVRYLTYTASLLKAYRTGWKQRKYNPLFAPLLFNSFVKIMNANIDSSSMMPVINELPYETGKLLVDIFRHNVGVTESNKILFLKFCSLYPERILQGIAPYADEPFADSLIVICSQRNPTAIYSASQAPNSVTGKLIHRNNNPLVTTIINISKTPNSLLYFPFLDDLLKGNQTFESIQKYIGDGETTYDSVGYFKLLVQTEISYFKRMVSAQKDTPVAMFGANGLREMLHNKALQHFIKPINEMHEKPEGIRMRPIEPLSSTDLYYMLIMGETEIYTSSYKYSFNRLIQRLGKSPKTDLLLLNVYFDYFKKFIKLAANFNKLDEFLNLMPPGRSQMLMRAFVGNLDKAGDLEDAVDVADSYSSITDKKLLQTILDYVIENENAAIQNDNARSKIIYGLLKTIFLSAATDTKVDLTLELGIPSIYQMDNTQLADENGRIGVHDLD